MNSALPFPCCRWGGWAAAPDRKGRVVQRSWWPLSHSTKEEEVVLNSCLFFFFLNRNDYEIYVFGYV